MAITLYDTTLRDGAQGEGINFSVGDKLRILQKLDDFGVHYVEGGWPGSNDKDVQFFNEAKKLTLKNTKLAAFGCTRKAGIRVEDDSQVKALLDADTPVVTIFGKVSRFHVENILKVTSTENRGMIYDTVKYLKAHGKEVIFDGEHSFDGFDEDSDFTINAFEAAYMAGASHLVLCDTNGGSPPDLIRDAMNRFDELFGVDIGIHTHDDCGLAVANAVEAVLHQATQIQGTVNGYGERTGNCNWLTTLAVLQLKYNRRIVSAESLSKLKELSLFVDEIANQKPNSRLPFVGASAFAHKGGIHVNAIKKDSKSYEHIDPSLVGNGQRILVGELSGRSNIEIKAKSLGIENLTNDNLLEVLKEVKRLEYKGYEFEAADASLELVIKKVLKTYKEHFKLDQYLITTKNNDYQKISKAFLGIFVNKDLCGRITEATSTGVGPVDALVDAFSKALIPFYHDIQKIKLTDYKVRILDSHNGTGAITRVFVEMNDGIITWSTIGVSDDIIEASWIAVRDSIEYYLNK